MVTVHHTSSSTSNSHQAHSVHILLQQSLGMVSKWQDTYTPSVLHNQISLCQEGDKIANQADLNLNRVISCDACFCTAYITLGNNMGVGARSRLCCNTYLWTMPRLCRASTALVMLKKLYLTLSPPSSQPPPSASQSCTQSAC